MTPETSIIIRAKNEAHILDRTLAMIAAQTYRDYEVILIDSGSNDGTIDIAQRHGCRIIEIPRYSPGLALNLAAEQAVGEYMVTLTAHAPPVDSHWLATLINTLKRESISDPSVAGVWGRAVAEPDANPIEEYSRWNFYRSSGKRYGAVNSAFRKTVWVNHPFDVSYSGGEDRIWAQELEQQNYRFIYVPDSVVYHSHRFSLQKTYLYSYRNAWSATIQDPMTTHHYLNPIRFIRRLISVPMRMSWFIVSRRPRHWYWVPITFAYQFSCLLGQTVGTIQARRLPASE